MSGRDVVLIVDDDELTRDMFSRRLERENLEVLLAPEADTALRIIEER